MRRLRTNELERLSYYGQKYYWLLSSIVDEKMEDRNLLVLTTLREDTSKSHVICRCMHYHNQIISKVVSMHAFKGKSYVIKSQVKLAMHKLAVYMTVLADMDYKSAIDVINTMSETLLPYRTDNAKKYFGAVSHNIEVILDETAHGEGVEKKNERMEKALLAIIKKGH